MWTSVGGVVYNITSKFSAGSPCSVRCLAPYAGSACADPDLANDIVNCNLGAAIGRLARMACGLKRPRPLPTKEEWEKEQSMSEVANARRSVNMLTRRDRGCEAPS